MYSDTKMESRVDLVTLSDSLTSPLPKPKSKARAAVKGTPKVVCLDSDTESDGSYTQTCINKSCYKTSNAANSGVASNVSEKANNRRLGLRKCSNDRKPSSSIPVSLENKCSNDQKPWSPTLSLSFKKEIEGDLTENKSMDQPKSCCDAGILEADFDADAKCKQDAEIKLLFHSNDPCSPQNVSSFGFKDKLHIDHKPLLQSKGIADVGLHSSYSPSASLDQSNYIGSFDSHSTSMLSASPCLEVKNAFYVESKPSSDTEGTDALKTYGLCSSLLSNESDGYPSMPAWNDHLKGIISKLETSKSTDVHVGISQEQPFEHRIKAENSDDDMDSGGYSSWKRKFYEPGRHSVGDTKLSDSGDGISCKREKKSGKGQSGRAGSGVDARTTARTAGAGILKRKIYELGGHNVGDGESSDSGDSLSCKRQKKSGKGRLGSAASGVDVRTTVRTVGDSTKALEKEAEKQKKVEKQMKDKEEKEAKKKHLKEERENLRREKQEEKKRQQDVRKMRNKEEKKRKEKLKAEAVERRKVEKEKGKWEKGKFALQNITAFVDTQILEGGLIGGHLLTRFAEKGYNYRLVKNPVKKTVIWQMKLPSKESTPNPQADSQSQDTQELNAPNQSGPELLLESIAVSYVLVVLEAEEFLDMITRDDLDDHIRNLQEQYPGFTLCYLINKLLWYLNKREQQQYKNPANNWIRPPVEQVLAKLVTSYNGVHSRLCLDEAEVSDHIVGLTRSLAECPFKRKLTPLSLSANGDHVVKNDPNSDIIKKDVWLKALVALPRISGSCAIAIAKKYPSMSAIFEAYLDPSKTVHEKEHLLQDLMKEGLLGGESNRRVGPACSRRVYRILMAQQGNLHTDDVEEGADLFMD